MTEAVLVVVPLAHPVAAPAAVVAPPVLNGGARRPVAVALYALALVLRSGRRSGSSSRSLPAAARSSSPGEEGLFTRADLEQSPAA